MELDAVVGLGAAPLVIYYLTDNIKSAWKYARDATGEHSPWPLMASAIGALWMVGAWASGWLPEAADSALAAVMLGIGTGAVTSKTYEAIKR